MLPYVVLKECELGSPGEIVFLTDAQAKLPEELHEILLPGKKQHANDIPVRLKFRPDNLPINFETK